MNRRRLAPRCFARAGANLIKTEPGQKHVGQFDRKAVTSTNPHDHQSNDKRQALEKNLEAAIAFLAIRGKMASALAIAFCCGTCAGPRVSQCTFQRLESRFLQCTRNKRSATVLGSIVAFLVACLHFNCCRHLQNLHHTSA